VRYGRFVIGRFRTPETLALLAVTTSLIVAGGVKTHLAWGWTVALLSSFLLFAYIPVAVRLQDWLLERYLARGWFKSALRIASAVRDSARSGVNTDIAEFEVGLVHLARGANADAVRSLRRVDRRRLKPKTRLVVAAYVALAELRVSTEEERAERGAALLGVVDEALAEAPEDPYLIAARGEAQLAQGDASQAVESLQQSLEIDDDPSDPSPGERHVLHARAALAAGQREVARQSYRVAARLRANTPFVLAARKELAALESNA
jgi:tetratricopeptide (TPR) repeat protein